MRCHCRAPCLSPMRCTVSPHGHPGYAGYGPDSRAPGMPHSSPAFGPGGVGGYTGDPGQPQLGPRMGGSPVVLSPRLAEAPGGPPPAHPGPGMAQAVHRGAPGYTLGGEQVLIPKSKTLPLQLATRGMPVAPRPRHHSGQFERKVGAPAAHPRPQQGPPPEGGRGLSSPAGAPGVPRAAQCSPCWRPEPWRG